MAQKYDYSFILRGGLWTNILAIVVVGIIVYPYIQTEILTSLYSKDLPVEKICADSNSNSKLRYAKIIEYEQVSSQARIYCLYEDTTQNTSMRLNQTKDWQVYLTLRLNKERNFYWPMYI